MDADNTGLQLHTEVRCLSSGWVLQRIFELREEIDTILNKQICVSLAEMC